MQTKSQPELTTDMLPLLEELYAEEKPEDRIERGKWYAEALSMFEVQYKGFVNGWKNYYVDLRKKVESLARKTAEKNDEADTSSIEQSIQQS